MPFTKGKICNNTVQTSLVKSVIELEGNHRPVEAILAGAGTLEQNIKSLGCPRAKNPNMHSCSHTTELGSCYFYVVNILAMNSFIDIYNISVVYENILMPLEKK